MEGIGMAYDSYVVIDGDRDNEGITVEATISIRVDRQFHINTSYGFAGISPGIIRIAGIIDPGCEAHRHITGLYSEEDMDGEYLESLQAEPVIKFQYQGSIYDTTWEDGYDYLPLAILLDHISAL